MMGGGIDNEGTVEMNFCNIYGNQLCARTLPAGTNLPRHTAHWGVSPQIGRRRQRKGTLSTDNCDIHSNKADEVSCPLPFSFHLRVRCTWGSSILG